MKRIEIERLPQLDYAVDEAINTLCTNLTFSGSDVKRIMLTSCKMSEGKSYVALNVSVKMAKLGKRVALVDADLRRSILSTKFGLRFLDEPRSGLSHYLAGLCGMSDIVYQTNLENMLLVPIGREISNSLTLLSTTKFRDLLERISEQVDYVIVDAPPVGMIIDAAEIAKSCDGTLFVVRYNQTHRREFAEAKRQIERTGCKVLGAALNGVTFDSISSKKYYYKSYYAQYSTEYYQPRDKAARAAKDPKRKRR